MARVTNKLQVTIPRSIAEAHRIGPGTEVAFESAGEVIHLRPAGGPPDVSGDVAAHLGLFDAATARQEARNRAWDGARGERRGWHREELYSRGLPG